MNFELELNCTSPGSIVTGNIALVGIGVTVGVGVAVGLDLDGGTPVAEVPAFAAFVRFDTERADLERYLVARLDAERGPVGRVYAGRLAVGELAVDDLHERAGSRPLHMHGELSVLLCTRCGARVRDLERPAWLARSLEALAARGSVALLRGDTSDLEGMRRQPHGPDAIVHCAGRATDVGRRALFRCANVDSVRNLVRLARELDARGALGGDFFSINPPSVLPSGANSGSGTATAAVTAR